MSELGIKIIINIIVGIVVFVGFFIFWHRIGYIIGGEEQLCWGDFS